MANGSKANILVTQTVDYQGLIGTGKAYRVPPYQRDYSWTEEQWEDLWNDIDELRASPSDRHYMGAMVVEAQSDRDLLIIDGQQRMATLSILVLAVIAKLGSLAADGTDSVANTQRATELRNRFIGERDPASLIETSRLFLNETDDAFYQDYLIQLRQPLNARGLAKFNRLLWDCFTYFSKKIESIPQMDKNGQDLARLVSETCARQLLFILITVEDDLNAYVVFETLNARGLELTTTDLLKNYLFSRVRVPSDLDALRRRWRALIATVSQERFPEFLRYHLLVQQPRIRSQRLFKLVRDLVRTPQDVFGLISALEARAELFAALLDPTHGYWAEMPDAKRYISDLNTYRVRQMTPLLFAAWEQFTPEGFVSILRLTAVISFRYSVVSGLNTNALEPAYHYAAKAISERRALGAQSVFELLRPIYVDDRKFQGDFKTLAIDTGGQRKKLVKHILARLEEDASSRSMDPETDSGSIEHILPENPAGEWHQMFPSSIWSESVYRLGNLTLLEPYINRDVGNSSYEDKLTGYARSAYRITSRIGEIAPIEWTPQLLNLRQEALASRAVQVWRLDF